MNATTIAVALALVYPIVAIVTIIRVRQSRSLDDESANPPEKPPFVGVVIPARNEARNIRRMLGSVMSSDYPRLEIIVVDDQSEDETGRIARETGGNDPRVRVITTDPVPSEWFGKQWACETGARASSGEIILFADADTVHSKDLITRSVNAILNRNADLFSIAGKQELGSFWEKLVQPQVFALLTIRYGGSESVTRSRFVSSKIANGQCLFVRRAAYEELGGHSLVKSHVAEDMMMAQRYFARGKRVVLAEGLEQLSTRMYTSLRELINGWGKNVFAGGRDSAPGGAVGRFFYPLMLLSAPLSGFLPALLLVSALFTDLPQPLLVWAAIAQTTLIVCWAFVYHRVEQSPLYALLTPVGAAMVFYIFARAVLRGSRVTWKGRTYQSR